MIWRPWSWCMELGPELHSPSAIWPNWVALGRQSLAPTTGSVEDSFFFKGCEMVIPFNLFHVWNAVICYQLHIHLWERFYLWIPSCAHPIQAVEEIYKVMLQAQGPSCIAMEPSWGLYYVTKWWLLVFGCTCWVEVCARNGSKAENIQARLNDIQCSAFNTEVIAGMRVLCEEVLDRCLWCLGSITELQIWKQPKRGRALISTTQ